MAPAKRRRPRNNDLNLPNPTAMGHEIVPETNFLLDSIRDSNTEWAISTITTLGLLNLTFPASESYFPRIIHDFYVNMRPLTENGPFATMIDGETFIITEADIATALEIPISCPDHLTSGMQVPFHTVDQRMRYRGQECRGYVHRAQFFPKFWLLDQIFLRNMAPSSHKNRREGRLLQALNAAREGKWPSPPTIIMQTMLEVGDKMYIMVNRLFYPHLITRILFTKGFEVKKGEQPGTTLPQFGLNEWDRCRAEYAKEIGAAQRRGMEMFGDLSALDNELYEDEEIPEAFPRFNCYQEVLFAYMKLNAKIDDMSDLLEAVRSTQSTENITAIIIEFDRLRTLRTGKLDD